MWQKRSFRSALAPLHCLRGEAAPLSPCLSAIFMDCITRLLPIAICPHHKAVLAQHFFGWTLTHLSPHLTGAGFTTWFCRNFHALRILRVYRVYHVCTSPSPIRQ